MTVTNSLFFVVAVIVTFAIVTVWQLLGLYLSVSEEGSFKYLCFIVWALVSLGFAGSHLVEFIQGH
jgi:hypothetical protein